MKTFLNEMLNKIEDRHYAVLNLEKDNQLIFDKLSIHKTDSSVVIIYGENASGKSLFSSIIEQCARSEKIGCRNACMRNRTSSGIEKAFIFGDEGSQSTGATSLSVAVKCLSNTLKEDKDSLAILDEPDVGLSDYYTPALGKYIAEQMVTAPEHVGLVLVSHSKLLMKSFLETYNKPVSTIGINTELSLNDWISKNEIATLDELLSLDNKAHEKYISILRGLEDHRKQKN